jgi:hypothetical protein
MSTHYKSINLWTYSEGGLGIWQITASSLVCGWNMQCVYERVVIGKIPYYRRDDGPVQRFILSNLAVYAEKT